MNKLKIHEGNTLIKKFMGVKNKRKFFYSWFNDELEYHNSWDKLMLVFDEIKNMGYPYAISDGTVSIYEVWQEKFAAHKHDEDTLTAAWKCVVSFIESKFNFIESKFNNEHKTEEDIDKSGEGDR